MSATHRSDPQGERRCEPAPTGSFAPQDRVEVPGHPDTPVSPDDATARTTGSERHCRGCSGPVRGRRRNGYCSDRCRMRAFRAQRRGQLEQLVANCERAFVALREAIRSEDL